VIRSLYKKPKAQSDKAVAFRALHQRDGAFIIPNPWDVGSARLLARMGFEALATTSVDYAFSIGRRDHRMSRDEMMAHAAAFLAGLQGAHFDLAELSAIGVKRVSVGGALSRVALAAFLRAAREMREHGTFGFVDEPISSSEIASMFDA